MLLSTEELYYLTIIRKPAQLPLRKDELVVCRYFEHTVGTGDQLHLNVLAQLFLQFVPQTGGTRFIVSRLAIFYGYFHTFPFWISFIHNLIFIF